MPLLLTLVNNGMFPFSSAVTGLSFFILLLACIGIRAEEKVIYEETTDLRFLYQCVDQHNYYRREYGDPLLEYDRETEIYARQRAMKMAMTGQLMSRDTSAAYGENVAWSPGTAAINCRPIVDAWYKEAKSKKQEKNAVLKGQDNGWMSSQLMGCAQVIRLKPVGGVITVCNYAPKSTRKVGEVKQNTKSKQ